MLVLSRKPGQRIRIGDSIVVTVIQISGRTARLGIEALPDLDIVREELLTRVPIPPEVPNGDRPLMVPE